jgi:hypothetical protein
MKKWFGIVTLTIIVGISSCDLINNDGALTTNEVVEGLKTALKIGSDTAAGSLMHID